MIPVFLAGAAAGVIAARKRPEETRDFLKALRRSGAEAVVMSVAAARLPSGSVRSIVAGSPLLTRNQQED